MGKKRIFTIVAIDVVFVGLLVLAIVEFKSPKKVSFSASGLTGFRLDSELIKKDGTINAPTGGLTPTELESLMMRNSITIYEPVKEGYTFAGWIITYNNQTETGDSATRFLKNVRREPIGAIALKATWA